MQADTLRVAARPRGSWEAIDLGFQMVRHLARPIWGAWALLVLPVGLTLIFALWGSPWWTLAVLWWLRPVADRVVLHVLGEALFGEPPSPLETARASAGWLRSGLFFSLTLGRFSPARTYTLPVLQLEGLRGDALRARIQVLSRREVGASAGMLSIMAHVNVVVISGLVGAWLIFAPDQASEWWMRGVFELAGWAEARETRLLMPGLLYLVGISVVEPFIVAGGFALYVNRRIWLEGWDLEIALRKLARRHVSKVVAALIATIMLGVSSLPVQAENFWCEPEDPATASACADDVLAAEAFGSFVEEEGWVAREFDWSWLDTEDPPEFEWLQGFGEWVASVSEVLIWLVAIVSVIALFVLFLRESRSKELAEPVAQLEVFGLDLDPAALPSDVVAEARAVYAAGDAIKALSLLYRGALVLLVESRGVRIGSGFTEGDCVRTVRGLPEPDLHDDFEALNRLWTEARYARAATDAARFEDVCIRWAERLPRVPS